MTLEQWYATPGLAQQWRQTWEEPHMQTGLAVLIRLGLPKSLATAMSGADAIHVSALRNAKDGGYYDFARCIETLKTIPIEREQEIAGWGTEQLDVPPPLKEEQPQ